MTAFPRIVSYLLHPVFMPMIGLVLMLHTGSYLDITLSWEVKRNLYLLFAINTIGMPILSLFLMRFSRMISSLELKEREERTFPFVMTLVYYGLTYYLLRDTGLPAPMLALLLGVMIAICLVTIINVWWKISIHMVGVAGLAGGFTAFALTSQLPIWWPLILIFLGVGLTGTSRLLLKAHSSGQVYAGIILGFIVEFVVVYYEWNI